MFSPHGKLFIKSHKEDLNITKMATGSISFHYIGSGWLKRWQIVSDTGVIYWSSPVVPSSGNDRNCTPITGDQLKRFFVLLCPLLATTKSHALPTIIIHFFFLFFFCFFVLNVHFTDDVTSLERWALN